MVELEYGHRRHHILLMVEKIRNQNWNNGTKRGALIAILTMALIIDGLIAGFIGWPYWQHMSLENPTPTYILVLDGENSGSGKLVEDSNVIQSYVANNINWSVTEVRWVKAVDGYTLLLSLGANHSVFSGKSIGGIYRTQAAGLCHEVLKHLPPGAPETVLSKDISQIGFRVYRPVLTDAPKSSVWRKNWSEWLVYQVVGGECENVVLYTEDDPNVAVVGDILDSKIVEKGADSK